MTVLPSEKKILLSEEERTAVYRIKNWVEMICRKKCSEKLNIYVSPYFYTNPQGVEATKTVICIRENLPDGPIIQLPKPVTEVTIEDLLSCYTLINYCKKSAPENVSEDVEPDTPPI